MVQRTTVSLNNRYLLFAFIRIKLHSSLVVYIKAPYFTLLCQWQRVSRFKKGTEDYHRAGTPLAEGYFAILWSIIGDLDYFVAILGLPNFSNASMPCALCRTSLTGSNTWSNFRPDAPWRLQQWTYSAWQAWPNRCQNPLFTLPGVSAFSICLDYMHSKYLGTDQYVFGSVLALLTCTGMMDGTPERNVTALHRFFQDFYRRDNTPVRYRYLNRLTMFLRQSGCPKLRGKAAELRYFGKPLLAAWEKWMNCRISVHVDIQLLLKMNVFMENLLSEFRDEICFPPDQAVAFEEACSTMLTLHGKLAVHFADEEYLVYKLKGQ